MSKFIATAIGAIGGLVVGALLVTIVDLYLAGHNVTPLGSRSLAVLEGAGIHVSFADGLALASAVAGAVYVWLMRVKAR